MRTVIIGGVAAGTKVAAKLKRESPQDEVVIYTKSKDISYAGCGLPYYIGGTIPTKEELIVNTPAKFMELTGAVVHTNSEVTAVYPSNKTITVNGEYIAYDKLVIAAGASSIIPNIPGVSLPGVFAIRTPEDAITARKFAEEHNCRKAVVVGGGFIGLEVAENLMAKGISVTIADMADQLMPNIFDYDMAEYLRRKLSENGIRFLTKIALQEICGEREVTSVKTNTENLPCDMVILAIGIRPATAFLAGIDIEMEQGLIVTDEYQRTNVPDIYAVGDCAMVKNRITDKRQWSAMGSTANIAGRNLALNLSGKETVYKGVLGTGIVKLSQNLSAAKVGLTETVAKESGYDTISVTCIGDDKAYYYPDSSFFITKLIADKTTHKLLGAQIIGSGSVDKMADIAVVGISMGIKADDYVTMDFAYAPPFSTAIHPFAVACSILLNKISGRFITFTPSEYAADAAKDYILVDAHPTPTIPGAVWMNFSKLNELKYKKDAKLLLVCAKGKRGYLLQNKLRHLGYTNTRVLEGGATFNIIKKSLPAGEKLPPEEIKRVKGLGCLQDKRFNDVFNVRIITKNGKITADEQHAVAEAAQRFGSGEITMTSRLTLEIQGVKYENLDALFTYLTENGLETGGTGSLVRPVVSCKGTTCQYGLIDTFRLSEKIHDRFYKGYHSVTLPHKFKIAVGGCPNNCVKPNLNDLGIIGQLVPRFDMAKCKGCKKCQVETACPIKIAKVQDSILQVDMETCNHCGRCKGKCPFGVTEEYVNGYKIYIGGRWGKKIANGQPLSKIFTSEEAVLDTIEKAILLFRDEGITGERFADTIARLGFCYVEDKLLNGEIEIKKEEILSRQIKGGASC